MNRLEAMALLVKTVESGSLSAASRALRVPVATLSRKLSALEAELNVRLLTRTTRKLSLTDAGLGYVAAARRILDSVEEAERQALGEFTEPKGELVITAPVLFGRLHVLPIVAEFLDLHPAINVRLLLSDRNVQLVEDDVDMAVRIGRLPDSALVATRVGTMRAVIAASPAFLKTHGRPKQPQDLAGWPAVTFAGPSPSLSWRFAVKGSSKVLEVPIASRLSVTSTDAALDAAIRGVGVTRLLHYQVAEAVKVGDLKLLLEEFEAEPVPVSLVHASPGQMPLKMRRFLDFAAPRLRQVLAALSKPKSKARKTHQAL